MPNPYQRPVLMRQADGTARLYMPYDADCIEQLKGRVPPALRSWDKADKSWLIDRQGIPLTIETIQGYFGFIEDIPAPQSKSKAVATPHAVLHLTDDAPLDLVTVVYRHLAKVNHPDKGGNTRAMQDINEAFAHITKGGRA